MAKQKIVRRTLANGEVKEYIYDRKPGRGTAIRVYAAARASSEAMDRPGLVYFIQASSGPIKIGWTENFARRIQALQDHNFDTLSKLLVILANKRLEWQLLNKFRDLNIRGEWFRDDPRIHAEIAQLKKEFVSPRDLSNVGLIASLEKIFRRTTAKSRKALICKTPTI